MTKSSTIALAAAAMFVAGTVAATSPALADGKCTGANACKGQSACKTASSSCKGQNACKGKGFVVTKDAAACTAMGGKFGA
jgi:hypothetical protein